MNASNTMIDDPDNELMDQIVSSNHQSFNILMSKYRDRMLGMIYNMMQNRQDAEDIWQDVMVIVWKKLHAFERKSRFSTWLYSITRNTTLNALKQRSEKHTHEISITGLAEEGRDPSDFIPSLRSTPKGSSLDAKVISCLIRQAKSKMLNRDQQVAMRMADEGMSFEEIAASLGEKPATIRTRIHYARINIATYLASKLGSKEFDVLLEGMSLKAAIFCN